MASEMSSTTSPALDQLRRYRWILLSSIAVVVAVTIWGLTATWNSKSGTTEFEAFKSLSQALVVVFGGWVLGTLTSQYQVRQAKVESLKSQSQNKIAHKQKTINSVLDRATAGYMGVKKIRRLLRAQACQEINGKLVVRASPYDANMVELNKIQLEFEMLAEQIVMQDSFFTNSQVLSGLFKDMWEYLGEDLIAEYEDQRPRFSEASTRDLACLEKLTAFLQKKEFRVKFSERFRAAQEQLRSDLEVTVDSGLEGSVTQKASAEGIKKRQLTKGQSRKNAESSEPG